jgi:hypothetical protein
LMPCPQMPPVPGNPSTPPALRLITTTTNFIQICEDSTDQGPKV